MRRSTDRILKGNTVKDSEIGRDPNNLGLPAGFDWPDEVGNEIHEWDRLYMEWDEAHADLTEKHAAVKAAQAKDAKALVDAVSEGKPDPGTKATEKAERAVVYAEEVARQARTRTNKQAAKLWAAIEGHRVTLMETACSMAEAGADAFAQDMEFALKIANEAIRKRDEAYAGLKFVARITGPGLSYDAFFPLDGSVQVPRTGENRARSTIALIRQLIGRERNSDAA